MVNVFAVPVFFICFRECLETSIIVSVLLAFLKQTLGPEKDAAISKKLVRQVWSGVILGVFLCVCIGAGIIGAFYQLDKNVFESAENIWEGVFCLVAVIIITLMGAALLRVNKLQDRWRTKITATIEAKDFSSLPLKGRLKAWSEKYAMFLLPFITILREGLEAVIFIGGVGLGMPASSFPLPVICGLTAGCLVGYLIYKGGNRTSLQVFLVVSTCFLYLVSAGLFSRAVWFFEAHAWNKIAAGEAAEAGSGPGSYNIRKSVWHVNCCSPGSMGDGGWGLFNSLFGWQNSATYGSVISYNIYWLFIILGFGLMGYKERTEHWPFRRPLPSVRETETDSTEEQKIGEEKKQESAVYANLREMNE
ncbi:plasma membrane iron permease-like protein [Delitschia confertaspora ATCC 74209]|uniref:Plasma membrane iron permease-like protein n=1 Tax=Delitschia confertaspora ATCC 74209 TaxID=1513339 RepID=A0A9P4JV44_9PLEO|nr:plasma membrane iron permease-like protein [Delitschia confertaspora ATCC 74209]